MHWCQSPLALPARMVFAKQRPVLAKCGGYEA